MVSFLLPFGFFLGRVLGMDLRSDTAYACLGILNSCFILLGIGSAVLAAKREKGDRAALLMLVGSLLFLPYYLNAYKLYSDPMSMTFVGLTIWLTIEADHAQKKTGLLRLLAGLSAGIGILLKGSVLILTVAAVIYLAVRLDTWRKRGKEIGCVLLGVLLVTQAWAIRSEDLPWLDTSRSDRYELPFMHWVMMASHKDGGFVQEDLDYSLSFETLTEKKAATKDRYIRNVKEQGLVGYMKFIVVKTVNTFSDGMYSQQDHLDQFRERAIGRWISSDGPYHVCVKLYTSVALGFLYLAVAVSAILGSRRKTGAPLFFHICMFGLILFFALWESKSRYLFNFTPVFLLTAALTIDELSEIIRKHRSRA